MEYKSEREHTTQFLLRWKTEAQRCKVTTLRSTASNWQKEFKRQVPQAKLHLVADHF